MNSLQRMSTFKAIKHAIEMEIGREVSLMPLSSMPLRLTHDYPPVFFFPALNITVIYNPVNDDYVPYRGSPIPIGGQDD